MRRLGAFLLIAAAVGGCELLPTKDLDKDFLRVLRTYKRNKPPARSWSLTPGQEALRTRLALLRQAKPDRFEDLQLQVKLLESAHSRVRYDALLALGEFGQDARNYLDFLFSFFALERPDGFDAFLLDLNDPALFHLRRNALQGSSRSSEKALRALRLVAPYKIRVLFLLAERDYGVPWDLAVYRASAYGPQGVSVLKDLALSPGRSGFVRRNAIRALGLAPGTEAMAALFQILRQAGPRLPRALRRACLDAAEARRTIDLAQRLRNLLAVAHPALRGSVAFVLARHTSDRDALLSLAKSRDPRCAAAGALGLRRLGHDVPGLSSALPSSGEAVPEVLAFLEAFPGLASGLVPYLTGLAGDAAVAPRVLALLARGGGEGARRAVRQALGSDEGAVRRAACLAAGRLLLEAGDEDLAGALALRVNDGDEAVALAALEAVILSACPVGRDRLNRIVERGGALGAAALTALVRTEGVEAVSGVSIGLFVRDLTARSAFLDILIRRGEPGAWAYVLDLLDASLPAVTVDALRRVRVLGRGTDVRRLSRCLGRRSLTVRIAALHALASLDAPNVDAMLADALEVTNPAVLTGVLSVVAGRSLDERTSRLVLGLSESDRTDVRRAAMDVLAASGQGDDVRARLLTGLLEGDPWVRERAIRGLARWKTGKAEVPLAHLLSDPVPQVRAAACSTAGILGRAKLVEALRTRLEDGSLLVRCEAARALHSLGEEKPARELALALAESGSVGPGESRWQGLATLGRFTEARTALLAQAAGPARDLDLAILAQRSGDEKGLADSLTRLAIYGRSAGDFFYRDGGRRLLRTAGRAVLQRIWRPAEKAEPIFLHRLRGPVLVKLTNGAFLKGELQGFRGGEILLGVRSGQVRIDRGQVVSIRKVKTGK